MLKIERLTDYGQIKKGDLLVVDDGEEVVFIKAKMVINADTDKEEIVIRKKKNHYFIVGMYLTGKSWAKDICIIRADAEHYWYD